MQYDFNRVAKVVERLPDHSAKLAKGEIVNVPKPLGPDFLEN